MKNVVYSLLIAVFGLSFVFAQDTNCRAEYLRYEKQYKADNYKAAYPMWKKLVQLCPDFSENIYIQADYLLNGLIEDDPSNANQYQEDLLSQYQTRIKHFPAKKNFVEGDLVSDQLRFGKIDTLTAINKLSTVFENSLEKRTPLSFYSMDQYFKIVIYAFYGDKISQQKYVDSYNLLKQVIQLNLDIRNAEKEPLEDKLFGKTDSTGKVIVAPQKLTFDEEQLYEVDTSNINALQEYDSVYTYYFNEYLPLDCEGIAELINNNWEANKNNDEWLTKYYYMLQDEGCEGPALSKVLTQWQSLQSSGVASTAGGPRVRSISGSAASAAQKMNSGDYRGAIPLWEKAINETSSSNSKASYALQIASSYYRLGSYSNTRNWANKALSYKPGYGQAYTLIAAAYYKGAGQLPGNSITQRQANWAAADMARRGGDYKTAAQYDKAAPSDQECFMNSITKGSNVKIGGWINTTTTARCVKR